MHSNPLARLPAEPDQTPHAVQQHGGDDPKPGKPPVSLMRMFDRIRTARARADLSKSDLARRVGVCLSAVVQWEQTCGTSPTVANLARIAWTTGVSFEWLATGRGPMAFALPRVAPVKNEIPCDAPPFEQRLLQVARRLPADREEALIEFARELLSS
jgi:transcriptional regulator with XRE-family HTH domain